MDLNGILHSKGRYQSALLGAALILSQGLLIGWQASGNAASAQDTRHYQIVTGPAGGQDHVVSVGISSLIKVRLLPSQGIDLDSTPTSGLLESFSLLRGADADFSLLGATWSDLGSGDGAIQAVATLLKDGERSIQLLARRDIDEDVVYNITKTIFENLEFLRRVDERLAETSLDHALDGMVMPLHPGARRYFQQVEALPSDFPEEESDQNEQPQAGTSPAIAARPEANKAGPTMTSDGKAFVVYFNLDQSEITDEGAAVLDEIAALPDEELENATVWMAGYTDTLGADDYNKLLGQRRVDTVRNELRSRGFKAPELYTSAFGERLTWIKTEDETVEARNRRVEIFIEYHGAN